MTAVKRLIVVLLIIVPVILLFLFVYEKRSKQEQSFSSYSLSDEEIELIHDGDIILRHGYGLVSDLIGKTLKEPRNVSHCAILRRDSSGRITVVHSVSQSLSDFDGVQSQGIKKFIRDSKPNSVVVLRYRASSDKSENSRISQVAAEYLKRKIPFDHSFTLSDTSSFYCTELLWMVFLKAFDDDIFLSPDHNKYDHLAFTAFWDTSRFEVIIDHHQALVH